MNEKIFELLELKGSEEHIVDSIGTFVESNGPKALKQLERVIRQAIRSNEVMDIVEKERGFDSRRNAEVRIDESHVPLESYDFELQTAIEDAASTPVLRCLDRSLWVYVDRDPAKSPRQK